MAHSTRLSVPVLLLRQLQTRLLPGNLPKKPVVQIALVVAVMSLSLWGLASFASHHYNANKVRVNLSNGTEYIHNADRLNSESWDNGLEILAVLDQLQMSLTQAEQEEHVPSHKLNAQIKKLDTLLADRQKLEKAAKRFDVESLYSPVYQSYLSKTQAQLDSLQKENPTLATLSFKAD